MPLLAIATFFGAIVLWAESPARADEAARREPRASESERWSTPRAGDPWPPGAGSATASSPPEQPAAKPSRPASGLSDIKLAPRGKTRGERPKESTKTDGLSPLLTTASSLAMVVGLILLMAWLTRRAGSRTGTLLPTDVVERLGRAPLAARQHLELLRFGPKLLLVLVTPNGAETLAEITDTDEVTRLAGLCRQAHPDSATASFRRLFQQLSREPAEADYRPEADGPLSPTAGHPNGARRPQVKDLEQQDA
jgi:flagellar biogenesis protein FliO